MLADTAHAQTKSHMVFASEYLGIDGDFNHWVVVPPRAPGQLLPIPPGAVRGLWRKPALSTDDMGKTVSILGDTIIKVGNEMRHVEWPSGKPPTEAITDFVIAYYSQNYEGERVVKASGGHGLWVARFRFCQSELGR